MNISGNRPGWWKKVRAELLHAFRLPSRRLLSADERAWLAGIAGEIVKRRMAAPALFLLESLRPLHFVGAQAMVFLSPVFGTIVPREKYRRFVSLLERTAAIDELIDQVETQSKSTSQ